MKSEFSKLDATVAKTSVTPETPKLNRRRMIKTSLENTYMRGIILNKDVEFKIRGGVRTTID